MSTKKNEKEEISEKRLNTLMLYLILITVAAIVGFGIWLYSAVSPREYTSSVADKGGGQELSFGTEEGWIFSTSREELHLVAGDSEFFQFEGTTQEFGPPAQKPQDYDHDRYYELRTVIPKGEWEVVIGLSPSLTFSSEGEQPFTVRAVSTMGRAAEETLLCFLYSFILWFLAFVLGFMVVADSR